MHYHMLGNPLPNSACRIIPIVGLAWTGVLTSVIGMVDLELRKGLAA
jgi:hypothetical protein